MHEGSEKVKEEVYLKYDTMMNRHNEIVNEMVERRKKELADSQFLYDRASANVQRYD